MRPPGNRPGAFLSHLANGAGRGRSGNSWDPTHEVIVLSFAGLRGIEPLTPRLTAGLGVFCVHPAWAHSCGCKSHRELITKNEAKRNCMRATECGEEAWSEAASR